MKNNWQDSNVKLFQNLALQLCAYGSNLLGQNANLVLHGGGNTSVKKVQKDIFGNAQNTLYIKGSGADLATIEPQDFVGLMLDDLQLLSGLDELADDQMDQLLRRAKINPDASDPSVETLVHAFLPYTYVNHTHADSILAVTNQKNAMKLIADIFGDSVAVIPYIHPGFKLAKAFADCHKTCLDCQAIIVLNHGIFTFSDDAKVAYANMIDFVTRAEDYIKANSKSIKLGLPPQIDAVNVAEIGTLIRGICSVVDEQDNQLRWIGTWCQTPEAISLSCSPKVADWCIQGPITPDHTIRTKSKYVYIASLPESNEQLPAYLADTINFYRKSELDYLNRFQPSEVKVDQIYESLPRVFVIRDLGFFTIGETIKAAKEASDIALHNLQVKQDADQIGQYEPISKDHIAEMEFWPLQRKKLSSQSLLLKGQVALVTGAAGAIGFGIAERLLASGATVVLADIDDKRLEKVNAILTKKYPVDQVLSLAFDVTNLESVQSALNNIATNVGGIDIIVANAGIAHVATLEDLDLARFKQVIDVNLIGTFTLIKAVTPIFRQQGIGGNIILISSKNVYAPGAAFGAYSASKAGAHQLARIASLELAELGVRVNMINPDGVFGDEEVSSKLWDLIGPERMRSRNLDPQGLREYYRDRNLLKESVKAEHVGNAVVFFASNQTPTTGATFPVDGGVPAAAPR